LKGPKAAMVGDAMLCHRAEADHDGSSFDGIERA
jgi:hypothetical protein